MLCALFEAALGSTPMRRSNGFLDCLHHAEPRGYVRLFVDHGPAMNGLLARVPAADPSYAYAQSLRHAHAPSDAPRSYRHNRRPRAPAVPTWRSPSASGSWRCSACLPTTLSSSEIADELCVATSTVRSHTKAVYGKLGVHTRLEAID